jgi:hypothetical protein
MSRLFLSLTLLCLTVLSVVTVSMSIAIRQVDPPPDPFFHYVNLLEVELNTGFACADTTSIHDEMEANAARQLCTAYPTDQPFSQVRMIVGVNLVQVDFIPREETMTVGDLARLWGRPQIGSVYRGRMNLQWPAHGITAVVSGEGQFSYFLAIERIIYTRREQGFVSATQPT